MVRARLSPGPALGLVLALTMAACGGSGAATEPVEPYETDELAIDTPAAIPTDAPVVTAPADGSGDSGNGWPSTVDVTISGQDYYDSAGSYHASGPARLCGNVWASMDPTLPLFGFEFPLDGEHNPRDVSFGADDLRPGTTTSIFGIAVSIVNSEGHEPPSVRASAGDVNKGDTGTASLTEADGIRTLVVDATSTGTNIKVTAVCGPAPA